MRIHAIHRSAHSKDPHPDICRGVRVWRDRSMLAGRSLVDPSAANQQTAIDYTTGKGDSKMKLMRNIWLAAIVSVGAMAFADASSATTALCKVQEETCAAKNLVTNLHLVNTSGSVETLSSELGNILCLGVLEQLTVSGLGEPQKAHATSFSSTGCGTTAAHNNCTVTTIDLPDVHYVIDWWPPLILSFYLGDRRRVSCTLSEFVKIECTYDGTGMEPVGESALENEGTGHGMFTSEEEPMSLVSGSGPCPEEMTVDNLLEPLEHVYGAE